MKKVTFLSFLCLLLGACSTSLPSERMPSSSSPRTSATAVRTVSPNVAMQYDHYSAEDTLYLYVRFSDAHQVLNVQRAATRFEYTIRPGSAERDALLLQDSVQVADQKAKSADGSLHIQIKVPATFVATPNVLQMRLWQKASTRGTVSSFFTLPLQPDMLQKDFMLLQSKSGTPLFRTYLTVDEKVLAKHYGTDSSTLQVQQYNSTFMPALPPMSTRQDQSAKSIAPTDKESFGVRDTLQIPETGLYRISNSKGASVGLLVQDKAYPQIIMAKDMVPPLIYLTTSEEREMLMKAQNPKAAIDDFWLKVSRDKDKARTLIRTFYTRVEEANRRFTCHKEGWASDRGMIYIIYGKPTNVSRIGNTESWIYRESASAPYIKFVFNKKEDTFTDNNYELIRRREYEENWYSTVSRWRAGITENM